MYIDIVDSSLDYISESQYDYYIFSSGFEMRSRTILNKTYKKLPSESFRKICISFSDYRTKFDRVANDKVFIRNDFTFLDEQSLPFGALSRHVLRCIEGNDDGKKSLSFLIDYSVMRRQWYSEILLLFRELAGRGISVKGTFAYTVGNYMGKKVPKIVDDYKLVPGYEGISSQRREKFGLYALGYEPISVQSLHDWVEPTDVNCFIANPGAKPGSCKKSYNVNKEFLSYTNYDVIEVPLRSVRKYCTVVTDIIKEKSKEFDIVLFGEGPKPFVLGDFVCSLFRPRISNIYLQGKEAEPINVEPTGDIIVTNITLI